MGTALNLVASDIQVDAILSEAKITACITGTRGGKTKAGAMRVCMEAINQPGYSTSDFLAGEPYKIGVGAPTYGDLKRVVIPAVLREIPDHYKIGRYHETDHLLKVQGDSGETWIYFITCKHVESWFGLKLNRIWADEFPVIKPALFDEFHVRLLDCQGVMFLTGTPQGPNWVYDRIYEPWLEGSDDINFFTWKTTDNPFIDQKWVEMQRQSMSPKYFRRAFEASWETFEGQCYDMVVPRIHYRDPKKYTFILPDNTKSFSDGPERIYIQRVVGGIDWGFSTPGCISICGKDSFGRWWTLDESFDSDVFVVSPEKNADSWAKRANDLQQKWQVGRFYGDPSEPEHIKQLKRAGIKIQGANNAQMDGIQTVAGYFFRGAGIGEPELMILRTCTNHIREIGQYHWKEDRLSGKSLEEPAKINDHAMDALRYAIHSEEKKSKFVREVRRRVIQ